MRTEMHWGRKYSAAAMQLGNRLRFDVKSPKVGATAIFLKANVGENKMYKEGCPPQKAFTIQKRKNGE